MSANITFPLSREGYVLNYLTTEAVTEPFIAPHTDKNQLKFEADMREIFAEPVDDVPKGGTLGEKSSLGAEWKFYAKNRNTYIDFSLFYFTLTRVNIHAQTQIISDRAKSVRARIWSYCTVDMWLNSKRCANIKNPAYKPINHFDVTLELNEGVNDIFIALQNFGVRDTRNMFSLQLFDTDGICVTLPVEDDTLKKLKDAEEWLCSITSDAEKLNAAADVFTPVTVSEGGTDYVWESGKSFRLHGERLVEVSFDVCGQRFMRKFDLVQNESLHFNKFTSQSKKINAMLKKTSSPKALNHGSGYYLLSRFCLNNCLEKFDYEIMDVLLDKIKTRIDCSDFALSCLFRIYKQLPVSDEYKEKIKQAALDFRYWMDEEGADAMCFWSENHSLLFFSCELLAGSFWPEEYFHRSDRRGIDQYKEGLRRVNEWFDVVEQEGFEEFLAGGYMLVTMCALLMVYDFSDEKLAARAKKALDRIVYETCRQCFDGVHIAPMGRIYRTALTPHHSGLQAFLYMLNDGCAEEYDAWLSCFALSSYKIPDDALNLISENIDITFDTGSASVTTKKTAGYMLTSVASPRRTPLHSFQNKETEYYKTKIMNEWFHGTSLFEPGKYGYQQHLWYAALSNRCLIFVNHPGTERDYGNMRPDYWYGNGVFPAIMQEGGTLYCYYDICDDHPTKFTHMYWPEFAMDETFTKDGYMFARCKDSYACAWCSEPLELNNTDAVMNCDYRAYGSTCAWVVRCGSKDEYGSFEAFADECLNMKLTKDGVKNKIGV